MKNRQYNVNFAIKIGQQKSPSEEITEGDDFTIFSFFFFCERKFFVFLDTSSEWTKMISRKF